MAPSRTPAAPPQPRVGDSDASRNESRLGAAGLDLVRSIVAPWERGDFSGLAWADRNIEYVVVDGPSPGRWGGLANMSAAFYEVLSPYLDYSIVAEEFRELDDESVLVIHRYRGVGKTSGLEIGRLASRGADVFHHRGGRVRRLVLYWDWRRALSDLGVSPESDVGDRGP